MKMEEVAKYFFLAIKSIQWCDEFVPEEHFFLLVKLYSAAESLFFT